MLEVDPYHSKVRQILRVADVRHLIPEAIRSSIASPACRPDCAMAYVNRPYKSSDADGVEEQFVSDVNIMRLGG